CPAKRIIMLAPANFGSRLAAAGKSMIGRVVKGWDNWFQTGVEMLRGLELASPYQWSLACRDLLDPAGTATGPYGRGKIWPFVIIGSRGYPAGLRRVANEDGADGTVRVPAANMNVVGMTIDFSTGADSPEVRPWHVRNDTPFPFAVLPDRDHSTVCHPEEESGAPEDSAVLGRIILQALGCASDDDYGRIAEEWSVITEGTAELAKPAAKLDQVFTVAPPKHSAFHQYLQVIVKVRDDHGQPVNDYFLEFFAPTDTEDDEAVYFQREVLEHVHVNSVVPSLRCLFVDRTDLMDGYYARVQADEERVVAMSISAAPIGRNVRHFDSNQEAAEGHLIVHTEEAERRNSLEARLRHNMTHLVEIIIPRQPIANVFRLTQQGA
ncbi:MAG TPA: hypothetical protein VN240_06330, partial [Propylenella sp.]|nr:hypothetical protein [Propylenella sp.]